MATQLSVFVENKPGKLQAVTEILFRNNINLRGISVASRGDIGVLKLLTDDPERAASALTAARHTVSKRAVVIAEIDDRPGSLHKILAALSSAHVNIDDCYGISIEKDCRAAIVFDIENAPETEQLLRQAGVRLLEDRDIHV